MKIKKYFFVDWDSKFFGFNVAQINRENIRKKELSKILTGLKKENYRLVYLFVSKKISYSLPNFNIKYICKKIIYQKKILPQCLIHKNIKKYKMPYPTDQMIYLAIESGICSRFKLDKNIDENKFNELYEKWIVNSVKKEIAAEVLIYEIDNKQAGLITFDKLYRVGKIGIIAVDRCYRRRSVGSFLLNAAEYYLHEAGYDKITIVTQNYNKAACHLYKKNGYHIDGAEHVYHIWL
jgi:dTDP-4-amino-4,6-dideoxy-D-galactose acyltransferase